MGWHAVRWGWWESLCEWRRPVHKFLGKGKDREAHQGFRRQSAGPGSRQSPVQENGGKLHQSQHFSVFYVIQSPRYPCLRQNTARGISSLGTLRFSHKDFYSLSILGTFYWLGSNKNKNEATSTYIIYLWSYYKSVNNLETKTLPKFQCQLPQKERQ